MNSEVIICKGGIPYHEPDILCPYCNNVMKDKNIEHINPQSKGGNDGIYNLTWCCGYCNKSKGNATMIIWLLNRMITPNKNVSKYWRKLGYAV